MSFFVQINQILTILIKDKSILIPWGRLAQWESIRLQIQRSGFDSARSQMRIGEKGFLRSWQLNVSHLFKILRSTL